MNHDSNNEIPNSDWTPQKLLSSNCKHLGTPIDAGHRIVHYLLYKSYTSLASITDILLSEPGKTGVYDYSLNVDVHEFLQVDPVLGHLLLHYFEQLKPVFEEAIVEAQRQVLKTLTQFNTNYSAQHHQQQSSSSSSNLSKIQIKGVGGTRIHMRLYHLPPHSSNCKLSLSSLCAQDVGKILQISGTVVRTSKVQLLESQRVFQCGDEKMKAGCCGTTFSVSADLWQLNNPLSYPTRCVTPDCKNKKITPISSGTIRTDYQEIKLQESLSNRRSSSSSSSTSRAGILPRTLLVKLQNDLVDKCQPGDDVVIVGTLISHWSGSGVGMKDGNITMAIHAHSLRVVYGSESNGNINSNGVGGGGTSSWDSIFEQNTHDQDEIDGEEGGAAVYGDSNRMKKKRRTGGVREDLVNEFDDFWNDERHRKKPIAARNFICQSVCPALYGLSIVKLALLLTLIGGSSITTSDTGCMNEEHENTGLSSSQVSKDDANQQKYELETEDVDGDMPVQFDIWGDEENKTESKNDTSVPSKRPNPSKNINKMKSVQTRRREQSHLLLVGDPGTGKSQFLRFAATLCPRSVLTSGSGTTSAGLTCAAVRDDSSKEFTLEAGALVLADRGVCAIDEFSCIAEKDRTTIHEAMEQQTLSVAKAGIVCKLNCRATVIAVTNAKGGIYDHDKTFVANVGIEAPLLSRFDLILKLIDGSDPEKDDNVATFLLNRAIQGSGYECKNSMYGNKNQSNWDISKLRAYVATVKSRFHPSISTEASSLLEKYYTECRSSETIALQITVRFLESLIRLAQGHARLMHRNVVELDDAVSVILLMECSVASCTSNSNDGSSLFKDPTSFVFPEEEKADLEFLYDKTKVLLRYGMSHLLSQDDRALVNSLFEEGTQNEHEMYASTPKSSRLNVQQDHYGRSTQSTQSKYDYN